MIVSIIVAMSENRVIAKDGVMPWHLPDEFKHFKETTLGHHVIMGRKTFDALGKALKGRRNLVITRQKEAFLGDAVIMHSLDQALEFAETHDEEEAFVIGGGEIYRQTLPLADRLYLTVVHHSFNGDVFFPEINYDEWQVSRKERHEADARHKHAFTVYVMERKHLA